MTEAQFQSAVTDVLSVLGWWFVHFRPARSARGWRTALSGQSGFVDLVAVRDARCLFIELKAQRGQLSAVQTEWVERLRAAGCETYVWRPDDWPTVERVLR